MRLACLLSLALALLGGGGVSLGANLLANGGFEDGLRGWEVKLAGEWAGKVDRSRVVGLAGEARSGRRALFVDTTALNPGGKITDALRTWRRPKYEITVLGRVTPVRPKAWYLVKLHVRSPGIAVRSGLEVLMDLKPWPLRTYGESLATPHWKAIHPWEGRLFLPQAPRADDAYHEHVLLKEAYPQTDTLAVGLRIRAPWTGRLLLDDVEVVEVDPARDMTPMARLLAMRAAKPIEKVRELSRQTVLVDAGRAAGAILVPPGAAWRRLGEKIRAKVRSLSAAELPLVTDAADVPKGASIVAVGPMTNNELVARLHFNRYVRVDAACPGAGGYVLWTVAEPYGLARKQNVLVVAGSDAAGDAAAVEAFCRLLACRARTVRVPQLHTVFPRRSIAPSGRDVPRKQWGYDWDRNRLAGFSKWYLSKWLETGDLAAAELARKEILKVADAYLADPYFQTAWDTYEVGWAWDAIEEAPVFSDADRLKITNALLAYLHMRPQESSDWSRMVPFLAVNPTWNHQAKGLSGAYTMGRYFQRFYGDRDGRYAYYVDAARSAFSQQARWSKPQENSGNYWLITMRFAISHYLGEWDRTFFESGVLRRYAEYFPVVCNNKGWLAGFGDTYYCYHGAAARAISGTGIGDPSLAFWRYRDGRVLWWLRHCGFERYEELYHRDVAPAKWAELLGVHRVPLEAGIHDPRSSLRLWGSGGEGTEGPAGGVRLDEAFDKISFRDTWDANGQYMLLEGIGRGIHSGWATNQICKLSLLGEDLLIGSCYRNNTIRTNDSVIVVKDAGIDDPAAKGKGVPARWRPLQAKYPAYAAVEAIADLPATGLARTALRGYQGTDWHRNVFWPKGRWFAVIDEVVANEPGTYYVESNLKTCPVARGRYPRLTRRTWQRLGARGGLRQTLTPPGGPIDLYLLTGGASEIVTEKVSHQYIDALMVRQVRPRRKLPRGGKVTFVNLFYGDRPGARENLRLVRLGPCEAVVFRGAEPAAYFGTAQGAAARSILPIDARMFLLTGRTLAVADATAAGPHFRSDKPASREIALPAAAARDILRRLAAAGPRGD